MSNEDYQIVDGVFYFKDTRREVIRILEMSRRTKTRIVILYGNSENGTAWGDVEEGTVSNSIGPVKIPILVYNSRSMGGPAILDDCIVKIFTSKGKRILYQHPLFSIPDGVQFYGNAWRSQNNT